MRVLVAVTYYEPHISGLTIYVRRLATALAARGHQVTVLTSQFDKALPHEEERDGVRIIRVPVARRVSKGVIMPSFGVWATRLVRTHDVVSIHLPQFDAPGIAARAKALRKPCVLTYHCDVELPPGRFNRVATATVKLANRSAAALATRIVAYTQDYADHAPLLRRYAEKVVVIPPPVEMPLPEPAAVAAFRAEHSLGGGPLIGYAARFAAEKGIEYGVDALELLLEKNPKLKVLFAGPRESVIGEEEYQARLHPRIEALGPHWEFLGTLPDADLPTYFAALDCLLLTSVNSTESFGLVQVEAMLCGTPSVASNLPGVRQPVRVTGMGEIVAPADGAALAEGVAKVLEGRERYLRPRAEIEAAYNISQTAIAYEALFEELRGREPVAAEAPEVAAEGPDYLRPHLREMAPHRALLRSVEARWMGAVPLVHPVLDVGCGDGHFASIAYSEPIDVGLDPMKRDIREAASRKGVYRSLVRGSATAMPFPDASFPTVVSNSSIEHIPDMAATLAEIARVLAPGGAFYTTVPSEHYPRHLLGATAARKLGLAPGGRAYGNFFNRISHHYHVYDEATWRELMAAAGLELVETFEYFSPAAHRAFDMAHYIGVPNLVTKRLFGRWVVHPLQAKPLERWYRRYYREGPKAGGAYRYMKAVKR